MGNLTLAAQNSIDTGATFYGDQDTGFELTKLQDPNFSKIWRYTPAASVDGSYAKFAFSLSPVSRASHVVLCRHNLGQGAQVRTRASTSRLDVDFTDGSEITSPWITFGGGTNGTRANEYGVMLTGQTCPRYEHDRRFHDNGFKYSEDLTQADWLVALAKKYSDGVTVAFEVGAGDPTERVTNGSFDTGTISGWNVLDNFGTASVSGGVLTLTDVSNRVTYSQPITVTPGKRYFVSAKLGGTGQGTVRVNNSNNFAAINTVNLTSGAGINQSGTFTATQSNMWVCIGVGSGVNGQTGTFDDITITEIGSQLYQVPGFMYADAYEVRAQVRLVSGDPTFMLKVSDDSASPSFSSTLTATTQWQWFSASLACHSTTGSPSLGHGGIYKTGGGGVFQVRRLQLRRGASNGKYRKTTSQRRYQRIGVISEVSSTNNCLQSADYTNAAWVKSAVTVTGNTAAAPDGTVTMDTLNVTAAGFIAQDMALGGTTRRAASFVFYAPSSTCVQADLYVQWYNGGVSQACSCRFNPSTGAFLSAQSITVITPIQAGVKDLGGGWFRAYVIGLGTDSLNVTHRTGLTNFTTTSTIVAWGHQDEANFVTTYIPTTTAAVTRSAQTAAVEPTTWVPYAANASEGTLYHEGAVDEINPDQAREGTYIQMSNGSNSYVVSYMEYSGGGLGAAYCEVYSSGVLQRRGTITNFTLGSTQRQAFRYRSGDWSFYLNGVKNAATVGSDTISFVPSITAINLMFNSQTTAYLRRVTLWPTGKSDADLQALTTSGPSVIDYESGWGDAMQMSLNGDVSSTWGYDYDVIRTFSSRAVEWVRVGIYDPDKTDGATPIECGRLFMGKLSLQPGINASFGLTDGWDDSATTFVETQNRRKVFNVLPKLREVIFDLPYLTPDEGAILHEMDGSGGLSSEVLYLSDPDDLAACQRFGFVGLMEKLDPLKYPLFNTRGKSVQIRKKR